ncbi:MAG: protein phosphatase 2C domain-containing protein [Mycobacterium sp.]
MIVGTPSPRFEPVPTADGFKPFPFRPDMVIDGWSMAQMTVRGTSVRGHFHRYNGAPRQDDFAIHRLSDKRIAVAVADGVSQAMQSHIGATTAVRYAIQWLASQAETDPLHLDWLPLLQGAAWALAEQVQALASLNEPDPARAEQELACTLVCALVEQSGSDQFRAHVVSVGDSGVWLLRKGSFLEVAGGKAVGSGGISSSAVSALPRVPNVVTPTVVEFGPGDVLMIGTDGIGDPLGSGTGGVGNLFRDLLCDIEPPTLLEFARAVDFSRETFDDDRTLVAIRVDRAA